jgi:hypothetical protein
MRLPAELHGASHGETHSGAALAQTETADTGAAAAAREQDCRSQRRREEGHGTY